jgi:hypothetical protein
MPFVVRHRAYVCLPMCIIVGRSVPPFSIRFSPCLPVSLSRTSYHHFNCLIHSFETLPLSRSPFASPNKPFLSPQCSRHAFVFFARIVPDRRLAVSRSLALCSLPLQLVCEPPPCLALCRPIRSVS